MKELLKMCIRDRSIIVKYRRGCMPIVKNQSNLIISFCEMPILVPYKKDML